MPSNQLLMFHLSDLHFSGRITDKRRFVASGLKGHDLGVAIGLKPAIDSLRSHLQLEVDERYYAIVSGDLTASGSVADFATARTFLSSRFDLDLTSSAGLSVPAADLLTVAGNHDHWKGWISAAYNRSINGAYVESAPWLRELWSPDGKMVVQVAGIDSNAGLHKQWTNIRAGGALDPKDLAALERQFRKSAIPPGGSVAALRVLVIHHCLDHTVKRGLFSDKHARQLNVASSRLLQKFISRNGIHAVLTGHLHDPHYSESTTPAGSKCPRFHEIRCATTLQAPSADGKQGFFGHHLQLIGSQIQWDVWEVIWRQGSFRLFAKPVYSFTV